MYDHKSLKAWKVAREVACASFVIAREYWKPWASALFGQLQRAALSVQLNIAEGWTFNRSPTYSRHLGIAYGSAVETGEILAIVQQLELLPPEVLDPLVRRNQLSQRLLLGLLKKHRPM
jgi:four helix bundle protein